MAIDPAARTTSAAVTARRVTLLIMNPSPFPSAITRIAADRYATLSRTAAAAHDEKGSPKPTGDLWRVRGSESSAVRVMAGKIMSDACAAATSRRSRPSGNRARLLQYLQALH